MADGEDAGVDSGDVDQHVARCAGCQAWRDAAHEVTRRARLGAVQPVRLRAQEVAAVARAGARAPRRARLVTSARVGLVAIAVGQFAVAVPCLLFGHDHSAPEHVAHEMGSFDAALAAGFLVAAWRPGRALGMRAVAGVAAALLVVTAVVDLAGGRTSVADEAPHLLAVAGWLVILYLASVTPPTGGKAGPVLAAWLRARLVGPLRRSAGFPAAAPEGLAVGGVAAALGDGPRGAVTRAAEAGACGCVATHCSCPGCMAPGRAAAG
jgi:predicted anti-sigma-YlaC factor YlaD